MAGTGWRTRNGRAQRLRVRPLSSGIVEQTAADGLVLILENGHCRTHAQKAQLSVEAFLAGIGVQDDFAVARRQLLELLDEGLAQSLPLKIGMDCYVAQVRAVNAVRH